MKTTTNLWAPVLCLLAGLGLGATWLGSAKAEKQYRECFAATTWAERGKDVNSGSLPKTLRVPTGWTPVGGGGDPGLATVILCR